MRRLSRLGTAKLEPSLLIGAVLAVAVFWVAYDDGSYQLASRQTVAIAIWWAIILSVALRQAQAAMPRAALVAVGVIAGLASWTLASLSWSPSAEDTVAELNRTTLYLGIYLLVILVARRGDVDRWCNGLALAIVGIATVALVSRLFPGTFPDRGLPTFLPGGATRLSFPLGYWNGLGIFVALGLPLLLRLATSARTVSVRAFALAPVPMMASVVYLTSSRGGVATAIVGTLVFLVLTEQRWVALAATAVASLGGVVATAVLLTRDELVNGPLGTEIVRSQGRSGAVLIALTCLGTAAIYGFGCRLLARPVRPSRWIGRAVTAVAVVTIVAGIVASDPAKRFEVFKRVPTAQPIQSRDFVRAHLLSGSGSGRWQFWTAAVDQWKENPVHGGGAGTYERWWAEHASFTYFVRDAHSLYLEALGELGVVGLVLTLGLALTGFLVGARRSLRASGEARASTAALTATFTAFGAAAAIDWLWEMTAVTVVAVIALALLTGPSTATLEPPRLVPSGESTPLLARWRFGAGIAVLGTAWVLIVVQAIPLLAERALARSKEAAGRGDLAAAEREAGTARDIQPWASSPYLQLALVSEERGDLQRARRWIEDALDRDRGSWRLWLVSARIETKLGDVAQAQRRLQRAAELNPRSPLFAGLVDNAEGS